jgi:hypothetical protein
MPARQPLPHSKQSWANKPDGRSGRAIDCTVFGQLSGLEAKIN